MKSGIDNINKNFNNPPKEKETDYYETYYSPVTKQWEQREVTSLNNNNSSSPHKIGNIGGVAPPPQLGFQRQSFEGPSSINKSKIDFNRIKDKKDELDPRVNKSKDQVRKSFYQQESPKSKCSCGYVWLIILGILILGAIGGALTYVFYLKPKYFGNSQPQPAVQLQPPAEGNTGKEIQNEVHSTLQSLQHIMNLGFKHHPAQQTTSKHLKRWNSC